jgi:undecaprenyl diphosphate synthase
MEEGIQLVHSGRMDRLDPKLRTLLTDIATETARNSSYVLNLALDYGGKDEILRALQKLGGADVTDERLRSALDHPELPEIDLVIRTSGEQRTSNFSLWQSAYAEWMFIDKPFPEFSGDDLGKAVDSFSTRHRRFGA